MIELATPRLVLRGWREDDLNALAAVNADPEVMRFIGDGSVRDREQTAAGLAMMEREWAERGFGIFAVEVRDTGQLAGWVGLAVPAFLPEVLPAVEIGWRLGRVFGVVVLLPRAPAQYCASGSSTVGLTGSSASGTSTTGRPDG